MNFIGRTDTPEFDTLPVIKTVYYPWTDGSFKPYCFAAGCFLRGGGFAARLTAFEREPVVRSRVSSREVLNDSCVALSLDTGSNRNGAFVSISANSAGAVFACVVDGPRLLDISDRVKCISGGGSNQLGWYWSADVFIDADALCDNGFRGSLEPNDVVRLGLYKFLTTGEDRHFGSFADIDGDSIYSTQLCEFRVTDY